MRFGEADSDLAEDHPARSMQSRACETRAAQAVVQNHEGLTLVVRREPGLNGVPTRRAMNLSRYCKVRHKSLAKNQAQLFSLFGLANLVIAKRALLKPQARGAS